MDFVCSVCLPLVIGQPWSLLLCFGQVGVRRTFLGSVWEVGGDRVVEEIMYVLSRLSRWTGSI